MRERHIRGKHMPSKVNGNTSGRLGGAGGTGSNIAVSMPVLGPLDSEASVRGVVAAQTYATASALTSASAANHTTACTTTIRGSMAINRDFA